MLYSKVKFEISKIIDRAQGGGPMPDHGGFGEGGMGNIEIMIPGNKVGLIIGKGGETIKSLQVCMAIQSYSINARG